MQVVPWRGARILVSVSMPTFRYGAHDASGKPLQGVIEADSLEDARGRLERRGWKPDRVQPAVLPKPRAVAPHAQRPSRVLPVIIVLVVLVAAASALAWFDPFAWLPRPVR